MSYNITVTMDQLTVTDATESTPLVTIRKPTSGGSDVTVDTSLSTSSYNAIANAPVATAINSVNASLTDVQSAVTALGNGSPTAVSTVAEMTDTTKIYLYTGSEEGYTAGNWYYYDGSAWVSGGTYGEASDTDTYVDGNTLYLEATVTGTINITENGTYNVKSYASAEVAVPTSDLGTKSITANGTYTATDDSLDGYSSVTVAVPTGSEVSGTKTITITQNGTTTEDVASYESAQITVNVSGGGGGNTDTTVTYDSSYWGNLGITSSSGAFTTNANRIMFTEPIYRYRSIIVPASYDFAIFATTRAKLPSSGTINALSGTYLGSWTGSAYAKSLTWIAGTGSEYDLTALTDWAANSFIIILRNHGSDSAIDPSVGENVSFVYNLDDYPWVIL